MTVARGGDLRGPLASVLHTVTCWCCPCNNLCSRPPQRLVTDCHLFGRTAPPPGGRLFPPGSVGIPGRPGGAAAGGLPSWNVKPGTFSYWNTFSVMSLIFVCGSLNDHCSVSPLGFTRYT